MQNWTEEQMQIVDLFLREEATPAQQDKLQQWMDSSDGFAEELEEYQAVFQSMSDTSFQQMMDHLDDAHDARPSSSIIPLRWLSIAASLILLVAVGWWLMSTDSIDQVQADFAVTTDQISLTTASEEKEALLSKAEIAYNMRDYTSSSTLLRQLSDRDSSNFRIQHYLGRSYYLDKDYERAASVFNSIITDSSAMTTIVHESRYWLALTYLAQEKIEASIAALEGHLEEMSGIVHTQSSDLLRRLKELD